MKNIRDMIYKLAGETVVVMGNGPSLNAVDIGSLKENATVFGTNRVYLSGHEPHYYVCVNPLVLNQFKHEILNLECPKFLPDWFVQQEGLSGDDIVSINTSERVPGFSFFWTMPMWEGHTVTYVALQIAYLMGAGKVILVGVDHDFTFVGRPNEELAARGPDPNHFHPDYFNGVQWHAPDLEMSEIAYAMARKHYEADGRRIINASARTKLDIFDIQPLNFVLGHTPPMVSALVSAYKTRGAFLKELRNDLSNQTFWPLTEAVVVCKEGSEEHAWAQDFLAEFPYNVQVVPTDGIPTIYEAWNIAIRHARGLYYTNANVDDRHERHAYEIMAKVLSGDPKTDLVYANAYITWKEQTYQEFVEENENELLEVGRYKDRPGAFLWESYSRAGLSEGCFIGPAPMWRANLHQRHGLFAGHMESAGDYEFWLRVAGEKNFRHLPMILNLYRARLDGVEMSDGEKSASESFDAQLLHQAGDLRMKPMGNLVRVRLGQEYGFVDRDVMREMTGRL